VLGDKTKSLSTIACDIIASGSDFLAVSQHSVLALSAGNHFCQMFFSLQFPQPAQRCWRA
jgi:hypothetical protein